jgi:hypothetical protein
VAVVAVFVMVGIAATGSAAEVRAAATVSALTVDGSAADWSDVAGQAAETEPKVSAVAQDGAFVYGYFESKDLGLARRVLRGGAIFWVNVSGIHGEGYGLRFRGTEAVQAAVDEAVKRQPQQTTGQGGGTDRRGNQASTTQRAPLGTVEVIKNGTVNEIITTGARDGGPAAACSFADGTLVFEFRAPIAELGLPADGERTVALGFQMSGRTRAEREADANRQGGIRPGGSRQRQGAPPAPAQPGGGEVSATAGAAAGDGEPVQPGGSSGATASAGGESRRRSYPTVWHDVTIVSAKPAEPPAAQ